MIYDVFPKSFKEKMFFEYYNKMTIIIIICLKCLNIQFCQFIEFKISKKKNFVHIHF